MNTVASFQVPRMADNFLNSWMTISFSWKPLLHGLRSTFQDPQSVCYWYIVWLYFGFETTETIMKDINYEKMAEAFVLLCLSHKLKMMDAMSLTDMFVSYTILTWCYTNRTWKLTWTLMNISSHTKAMVSLGCLQVHNLWFVDWFIFVSYFTMLDVSRLYSTEQQDNWEVIHWNKFGKKCSWPNWSTIPSLAWRNPEKPWKTSG
jgi:hypothetical protein